MKKNHAATRSGKPVMTLVLLWFLCLAFGAHADYVPEVVRKAIERTFPGAVITGMEQESWQGQPVLEVEITTREGKKYEIYVTPEGEIVKTEEESGLPWIGGELSLGAAFRSERSIYKGVDTERNLVPFLRYENGRLEIRTSDGFEATYTVFQNNRFSIAPVVDLDPDPGYDPDESEYLKGMETLGTLFGAGLAFESRLAGLEAGLDILQELGGEHHGREIELSLTYPWRVAGFELRPEVSISWLSKKTVDYLYGVSVAEARPDRPAYSPGSSYEIGAELMIQRPLFGKFTAVGIAGVTWLGGDITGSPLVDEDYEFEWVLGVMYTF